MPAKRKIRNPQKKTPPNGNPQRTPSQCDRVQQTVHNGQRELDHREYDQGYGEGRQKVLRDQKPGEDQGADEGCFGAVENLMKEGLGNFPKEPPPALFEATDLIDAATAFWGLEEGDIVGRSRKAGIVWPRYVCVSLLRGKGMTLETIGKVLGNRDHGTIINALHQFKALTNDFPAYKEQAKIFDRYCWNTVGQLPTKRYKAGVGTP